MRPSGIALEEEVSTAAAATGGPSGRGEEHTAWGSLLAPCAVEAGKKNRQASALGPLYSHALNYWGVKSSVGVTWQPPPALRNALVI